MTKSDLKISFEESFGKGRETSESRPTNGAYCGKGINERHLVKIDNHVGPWLDNDEKIIAIFKTNGIRTLMDGLILSNKRVVVVNNMSFNNGKLKFVEEIAADDIARFASEKGLGKLIKVYAEKKTGEKVYVGMATAETSALNSFLGKMSGNPKSISDKMKTANKQLADEKSQAKAEEKQKRKLQKAKEREAEKQTKKELKKIMGIFPDKKALRNAEIQEIRESLENDRKILLTTIVATIRQHWNVLEDKLELHAGEDDYGNTLLGAGFQKEFTYFSEKIVLPELKRQISEGKTSHMSLADGLKEPMFVEAIRNQILDEYASDEGVTYILMDTIKLIDHIRSDYFGISFSDSDELIADKLLSNISESMMDDDLLFSLKNNRFLSQEYLSQSKIIFLQNPTIELVFGDSLKTHRPMKVTVFVSLVFLLFSALHNSKTTEKTVKRPLSEAFTGNDPYKYEDYIKTLLRNEGFEAKRTRGSGDFGVDVFASKNGVSFAIQCKLYNRTVGTKAVQEIVSGRIYYKADFGVVVSDNTFTDAAKMLARKSDVVLTHHKNLLHKLENLVPSPQKTVEHVEVKDNQNVETVQK